MLITYQATLESKTKYISDVYMLRFSFPEDQNWSYQSGQYMIFHLPSLENEHPVRRLYSIASAPSQKNSLDFIIEIVPGGIGSTYIEKMHVGDTISLQGPAGIFTYKPSERDVVMLATGTGIAPMYSMITDQVTRNPTSQKLRGASVKRESLNMYLFWGLKYEKDIYLKQELDKLVGDHPNFQYSICLSREEKTLDDTRCMKGRVTNGLESTIENCKPACRTGRLKIENFDYYLCGSPHIVESLRSDLESKGVPKNQVYFEKFT